MAHVLDNRKTLLSQASAYDHEEQLHLEAGLDCHKNGHIDQAIKHFQQVILLNAGNINALQLLSAIAYQQQNFEIAQSLIQRAITQDNRIGALHKRLGDILSSQQQYAKAKCAYKKALKYPKDTNVYETYNSLGLLYHQQGDYQNSAKQFKKSIHHKHDFAIAWNNYGNTLIQLHQYDKATDCLNTAIKHDKNFSEAWRNLGDISYFRNEPENALEAYRQAILLNPNHVDAINNLGCALRQLQRYDDAMQYFEKAASLNPSHLEAIRNAAELAMHLGDNNKSLSYHLQALNLDGRHKATLKSFTDIAQYLDFTNFNNAIAEVLQNCYRLNNVNHQSLSKASAKLIRLEYDLDNTLLDDGCIELPTKALTNNNLFKRLLTQTINEDIVIENLLQSIRKKILEEFYLNKHLSEHEYTLSILISIQMHNNEYILEASEQEEKYIEHIKSIAQSNQSTENIANTFTILSMYQAPSQYDKQQIIKNAAKNTQNELLNVIYQRIIYNPDIEQDHSRQIQKLAWREEGVSHKVAEQYEENPYPRWLSLNTPEDKISQPHVITAGTLKKVDNILVAGCGTGKHPITLAFQYPQANIIAIDLSLRSLSYAKRMAEHYHCQNIQFLQANLLELDKLNIAFDLIESIGVLHHLKNPIQGWKSLLKLLHPNGLIKIALYSQSARSTVTLAREYIANNNIPDRNDDIRRFRKTIINMPANTALSSLTNILDFYSLSGCRDLLFHRQEHCFTLPQIGRMLNDLSLELVSFDIKHAHIKNHYLSLYPDDKSLNNLDHWHQYEQRHPETFINMYQFYAKKLIQ